MKRLAILLPAAAFAAACPAAAHSATAVGRGASQQRFFLSPSRRISRF